MATANPIAYHPYKPHSIPHSPPPTPPPNNQHSSRYPDSARPDLAAPADTPEHRPTSPSSSTFQSLLNSSHHPGGFGTNVQPPTHPSLSPPLSSHMSRSASDSIVGSEPESSSMAPSRSATGDRSASKDTLTHSPSARARVNPPTPQELAAGYGTSTSYLTKSPGSKTRERLVSPSKLHFEVSQRTPPDSGPPVVNIVTDNTPKWSSGIEGKSEAFQRQAHGAAQDDYDPANYATKARSRSPFSSSTPVTREESHTGYLPHPLSVPAYNHPTREHATPASGWTDSTATWLCLYFFFNLGLTLFNKIVLVSFPFPYTLTGLHALSGCAGCYFALERGAFTPARLTQRETMILGAFSVLYTINIAVSNISLQLVTVPFHQVVRASTPLFTILISAVVLRTRFTMMKLVSLLPVVAGVGFATYGDYYFTAWGLILTLLGTFLAALKTVVTNLIQTGGGQRLKLHPLDLLMRMSPLAFVQCVIYGWYTGELERVRRYGATQMTGGKALALLVNGIIACGLNIVSFTANKKAGPLTMTVSANCKQVLTIALAVVLFDLKIAPTNAIGILLTLIGGGWYGYVEYNEKKKKSVKLVDRT